MSKILMTLMITLTLFFGSALSVMSQNGYNVPLDSADFITDDIGCNVPLDSGMTSVEFTPDDIWNYEFDYSVTGLQPWSLAVKVYWQSDTYPGWHESQVLKTATGSVMFNRWLINDNVRYRVEFWTNSTTAIGNWSFLWIGWE